MSENVAGAGENPPLPVLEGEYHYSDDATDYDSCVQAFNQLGEEIQERIWYQAALCYRVHQIGGRQSLRQFADDVGKTLGYVYKLARMHRTFRGPLQRGEVHIPPPEPNATPTSTHITAMQKSETDEDARSWAQHADDEGWSRRRLAYEMDHTEPSQSPAQQRVEPVRHTCPLCDGHGDLKEEEYRWYKSVENVRPISQQAG